tara:strand:+ start:5248 stop:5934 length:687 start_codon:yes stop_codon:yes gene_type:complete
MKLSIIIPCYNEINTIDEIINAVLASSVSNKEIIIVDDCSNDGTQDKLKTYDNKNIKIIFHENNQGKGSAIRSGIEHVTGDIVLIQDADLEYNPSEYQMLIDPILNKKADVVYGSRFAGGAEHRVLYFWHRIGNGVLTFLSNMLTNLNLTDMETGYKVFRKDIIKNIIIEENRFGFEPEITAKISKLDCRIFEIGISYNGRKYSEGKKIGWKDGFSALWCIIKYNILK